MQLNLSEIHYQLVSEKMRILSCNLRCLKAFPVSTLVSLYQPILTSFMKCSKDYFLILAKLLSLKNL